MDLTGFTTQFVVVSRVEESMSGFAELLRKDWPDLVLSTGWAETEWLSNWTDPLGPEGDVVFFARDMAMVRHFNDSSFTPMKDGSSVVAVSYYRMGVSRAPVSVPANEQLRMRAYEAEVLLPVDAAGVELTTPEDPQLGAFSGSVLRLFVDSFRA